jgi:DNA-binding IclR family transcriptional regulator
MKGEFFLEPTENNETTKTSSVQVISRAATILRVLKDYPLGLSLGQIAKKVNLARSTVQRIVYALEEEKFIVQSSTGSGFRLGHGLAILGSSVHFDLREDLHPYIQQLSIEIDETVDLAILDSGKAYFIDQITASHRLQAVSKVGTSFPLYCTANGKAILSTMSTDQMNQTLPDKLDKFTSNTITSKTKLQEEIDMIKNTGIAYDREEHSIGICAIGTAIQDPLGNVAAISIPLPTFRFYGNEGRLIDALLKTCAQIKSHYTY